MAVDAPQTSRSDLVGRALRAGLPLVVLLSPCKPTALTHAPPSPSGFEYWRAPTTQIGTPLGLYGTEITPEGDLYTGFDEFDFEYGYQGAPGTIRSKQLLGGSIPIVSFSREVNQIDYRFEMFGTSLNGRDDGPRPSHTPRRLRPAAMALDRSFSRRTGFGRRRGERR